MSGANASPAGRSHQETDGANASPAGRSHQETDGANASPAGRSHQETDGANASPAGRGHQETDGANASPAGRGSKSAESYRVGEPLLARRGSPRLKRFSRSIHSVVRRGGGLSQRILSNLTHHPPR